MTKSRPRQGKDQAKQATWKGDIVFFRNADSKKIAFSGIVYAINESGSFDFIYAAAEGVKWPTRKLLNTGNFSGKPAILSSDKDLKKARKAYKNR